MMAYVSIAQLLLSTELQQHTVPIATYVHIRDQ